MTAVVTVIGLNPPPFTGSAANGFGIGFALFVVPALYTVIGKKRMKREGGAAGDTQPAPA